MMLFFFFSSRRRHTRCALVTGVQTCALPISVADVKLTIAGRPYDVHCADGQEAQLVQLASVVDETVRTMPGGTETRHLLFAALMLADEMQDARGRVAKTEPPPPSLRAAASLAASRRAQPRDALTAAHAPARPTMDRIR